MSKPKAILRADANKRIGYGHFVRSSALAERLSADFDCRIVSLDPDSTDYPRLDTEFMESISRDEIVVLDNYYFDTGYQRKVRNRAAALVCIDDLNDRHFVADLFLTFSPLPRSNFSLEPYTQFFGGVDHAFLRAPFLSPIPARTFRSPRHILLALGGSDPLGLTDKIANILLKCFPDAEITVIGISPLSEENISSGRISRRSGLDAGQMAHLMDQADLGVFPASTLCVEALSRRLPVAVGFFADNQLPFYRHGTQSGWWLALGDLRENSQQISSRFESFTIPTPPYLDFARHNSEIIEIFKSLIKNQDDA